MQIKIPLILVRLWDWFVDVVNIPLYVHRHFELLIIDVLLLIGLVVITTYYGIAGAIMYVIAWALSLMVRA
jgi:hypothetical protein